MLSQVRQSKKEGFTIIEVLIVLAIAGLIMLVVFLAVPALQRNSRNTQRTTDAGNILSSISEYVGNNNGRLPASFAAGSNDSILMVGAGGSNQVPVNLGYFDAGEVTLETYASGAENDTDTNTAVVMKEAVCDPDTVGAPANGNTRSVVILYTLEGSGAGSKQCRAS